MPAKVVLCSSIRGGVYNYYKRYSSVLYCIYDGAGLGMLYVMSNAKTTLQISQQRHYKKETYTNV